MIEILVYRVSALPEILISEHGNSISKWRPCDHISTTFFVNFQPVYRHFRRYYSFFGHGFIFQGFSVYCGLYVEAFFFQEEARHPLQHY